MSLKLHKFGNNLLSKSLLKNFITTTITIRHLQKWDIDPDYIRLLYSFSEMSIYCGVICIDALIMRPGNAEMAQKSSDKLLIAQSVDEQHNLKFESRGCRRINNKKVTCDVLVTNIGNTRADLLFVVPNSTTAPFTNSIDSSGTVYAATVIQMGTYVADGKQNLKIRNDFGIGIPTKVTFSFEIPESVNELAAIDVGYGYLVNSVVNPTRITIANIGAIASQSNTSTVTSGGNNCNCNCPNNSGSSRPNNRKI
jgi:hypothetical protein